MKSRSSRNLVFRALSLSPRPFLLPRVPDRTFSPPLSAFFFFFLIRDQFEHRSMPVPREQWGKTITLEFSPRASSPKPTTTNTTCSSGSTTAAASDVKDERLPRKGLRGVGDQVPPSGGAGAGVAAGGGAVASQALPPASSTSGRTSGGGGGGGGGSGSGGSGGGKGKKEMPAKKKLLELPAVLGPGATPLDAR